MVGWTILYSFISNYVNDTSIYITDSIFQENNVDHERTAIIFIHSIA